MAQLNTTDTLKSTSVSQALKDPKWYQPIADEYDALAWNRTWELVPTNPKQNVVGCKGIFQTKFLPNGSIDKYKARLVANRFHQRLGVDFHDTFSPVVKPNII